MNRFIIFGLLSALLILQGQNLYGQHFHQKIHKPLDLAETDPPNVYNEYFAGAGACMLCHNSMTDSQGNSVAIVNDWRSAMMANASKDPFWQAKVSHEVLVNPHLKNEIETVCTRCHAPMGNVNAIYNGDDHFTIQDMKNDTLAMDGVSCTVCHQIAPESMGNSSGNFIIGTNKQIWGPYPDPFSNPMIMNTGYTPIHSNHIKDSRLCGSCHTLLTNSLDLDGVPTGEEFVEQAIYQEWKNSSFSDDNLSCYHCHIPEISDVVKISTMPPWLDGRTPFGKHHMQGANVFLLNLLKNNIDQLSLTTNESQIDSTMNRTLKNLQQFSVQTSIAEIDRTSDSLFLDLELVNMAGHKLPTGYPSRRVFVEFIVTTDTDDTLFHSGRMNDQFELVHENETYEPHHKVIKHENQVQIYEMVMGDVDNNVTTVLERAYLHLKDNRIPPSGFTSTHNSYDTVKVVGYSESDVNFNKSGQEEGTGSDIIHYRVSVAEHNLNTIFVTARVYYQTVTNKWLANMFTYNSEDIDLFKNLYQEADKAPVLMNEISHVSLPTSIFDHPMDPLFVYPNPAEQNFSVADLDAGTQIKIYTISGRFMSEQSAKSKSEWVKAPDKKGIYLVQIINPDGKHRSCKLVVN